MTDREINARIKGINEKEGTVTVSPVGFIAAIGEINWKPELPSTKREQEITLIGDFSERRGRFPIFIVEGIKL